MDEARRKDEAQRAPLGFRRLARGTGSSLEYYDGGSGPVIVMIPALGCSAADFTWLAPRLQAEGFRTLCVELPGMGHSAMRDAREASLFTYADAIASVIEDADIPTADRVFVLGRSLGNRIARVFAARFPNQVRGVILLAAGGRIRPRPDWRRVAAYSALLIPGLPLRARRRLLGFVLRINPGKLPEGYVVAPSLRAVRQQIRAVRNTPASGWHLAGGAPMLVLQGDLDPIAPPANAIELRNLAPERVELVLVRGAGHAFLFDHPELVLDEVLGFLNRMTHATPGGSVADSSGRSVPPLVHARGIR